MAEERARVAADINKDVKVEAQVKALREDITLQEVIERLLAAWIMEEVELPGPIDAKKFAPTNQVETDTVLVAA